MKAARINGYGRNAEIRICDIPIPEPGDEDVLIRVMAAAVNPVDILNMTGEIRLIQDYSMPLTLGNECAGVVVKKGRSVRGFSEGDRVYSRLPVSRLGAFAEYVSVPESDLAHIPEGLDWSHAAAIPLTGLTAYQAITEVLKAKPGQTLFIPGGSGSFGQMAVPIAKALGLRVIVSGNGRSKEHILASGADRYIVYTEEHYSECLSGVDYVIDTLGGKELAKELSVLRKGGILLSLRTIPNGEFARRSGFPLSKRILFTLAGMGNDLKARLQGKQYRFLFVRSDGSQLEEVSRIVRENNIIPRTDPHTFSLDEISKAIELVRDGHPKGKVIITF